MEPRGLQTIEDFASSNDDSPKKICSIFIESSLYVNPCYSHLHGLIPDARLRMLDTVYTSSNFPRIEEPCDALYIASNFNKETMSHIPPVFLIKAISLKDAILKYFGYILENGYEPSFVCVEPCMDIHQT